MTSSHGDVTSPPVVTSSVEYMTSLAAVASSPCSVTSPPVVTSAIGEMTSSAAASARAHNGDGDDDYFYPEQVDHPKRQHLEFTSVWKRDTRGYFEWKRVVTRFSSLKCLRTQYGRHCEHIFRPKCTEDFACTRSKCFLTPADAPSPSASKILNVFSFRGTSTPNLYNQVLCRVDPTGGFVPKPSLEVHPIFSLGDAPALFFFVNFLAVAMIEEQKFCFFLATKFRNSC